MGKKRKGCGLVLIALMLVSGFVWAQTPITLPSSLSAKQGIVETFDGRLQNTTTFEILKTREITNAPKWLNAVWVGNSVDGGFAYDAMSADNAVLLVSRHINDWANYLPVTVPEAVKAFDVSVNLGIEAQHFTNDVTWTGCGGFSYLKASVVF